jgi:hypothetical protein
MAMADLEIGHPGTLVCCLLPRMAAVSVSRPANMIP